MSQQQDQLVIGVVDAGSSRSEYQSQAEMKDIDLSPDQQLALHYKRTEIRHQQLQIEFENANKQLRELSRLRKDRFDSICNSVLSALLVSIGTYMGTTGKVPVPDVSINQFAVTCIGWVLVVVGVIFGVFMPPVFAILYRVFCHKEPGLRCIKCGSLLEKKYIRMDD